MADFWEILLWVFVGATVLWAVAMTLLYVALGVVLGDVVGIVSATKEPKE